jgi:hypothetical protein
MFYFLFRAVNAFFLAFELIVDNIVGWIPMYYEAKVIFLGWMVLPSYRGATKLYEKYFAPVFLEHEKNIDTAIDQLKRQASERFQQVCKETASLAVQKSSEVLVHGQNYVTNQIVQQLASNDLSPLLRPLSPTKNGSNVTKTKEETSSSNIPFLKAKVDHFFSSFLSFSPPTSPSNATAQVLNHHHSHYAETKNQEEEKDQEDKKMLKKAFRKQEEEEVHKEEKADDVSIKAEAKQSSLPSVTIFSSSTTPSPSPTNVRSSFMFSQTDQKQEKSKELVNHFKKLLVRGFKLKYHPSKNIIKQRILKLSSFSSRYLLFESTTSSNTKSVKLFLLNIRRVSSFLTEEQKEEIIIIDTTKKKENGPPICFFFCIENGTNCLVFEAESEKTRDLLVSGMRLLILEHKKQDTKCFNTLNQLYTKQLQQQAFDRLVDTLRFSQKKTNKPFII